MVRLVAVEDVVGARSRTEPDGGAGGPAPAGGQLVAGAQTAEHRVAADVGGDAAAPVVTGVEDLARAVAESVEGTEHDAEWGTFFGLDPDTGQVVGTCGYNGAPRGGRVEIAFWTFPPFEGRGWATAMARTLVERAMAHPDVLIVLAHTLPEKAPATSVLTAAGLRFVDTVRRDERASPGTAPVRGKVWRWEHRRRGPR